MMDKNNVEEKPFKAVEELLSIPGNSNYLNEWNHLLAQPEEKFRVIDEVPVVIFRLGYQWLALPTHVIDEITEMRKVHSIPHRTNKILLGVVNLRGQLELCVSMHSLLGITECVAENRISTLYSRMLSIRHDKTQWIFKADEVYGIYRFPMDSLQQIPVTAFKSNVSHLKGIFEWGEIKVGLINEELLIQHLRRSTGG